MSLELLGAVELRAPLAEVVAIGTEAQRLDAEEAALEEAYREVQSRRFFSPSVIIGASIGGALAGPIGVVLGSLIGYALKEPENQEDTWRRVVLSDAARKSPTLMKARRALVNRDLAQAELWAQEQQREADDRTVHAASQVMHDTGTAIGATEKDIADRTGLPVARVEASLGRLMKRLGLDQPQPPTSPGRPPLTLLPGGKGSAA